MLSKTTPGAKAKRGRKALPDAERKGNLVQTRIPADLDSRLRDEAKRRRVTVSQLVRATLEEMFLAGAGGGGGATASTELATLPVRDGLAVAELVSRGDPKTAKVEAWQEVVLGKTCTCARCGKALRQGQKALLGVS